ncbi:hypothetical protein CSQ85_01595 [Bifidobacterium rousetti]|uniref:hypothetical protein n=1 Tax=Bifidobacterium rousetti TaxID=2045439 RepID=UPI001239749B|nr:hypothetical protein [Bifidobacterium rousetti]KAA8820502.1 hypothetical protein CSQ85_01595 [Bifidobacterium rousetti]
MEPLASLNDLAKYKVEYDDEQLAQGLLDSVSSAIRAAAGCPISLGTYTIDLPSEQSRKLDLPCKAVRSVESVLLDGEECDDWVRFGSALYRDKPWGPFNRPPVTVTVTLTMGWDPVPEDIVRLCCSYVAAAISQHADGGPGAHRGISYERIDDAQVGYSQGGTEVIDAAELPDTTKRSLRRRFGVMGVSIGVFR